MEISVVQIIVTLSSAFASDGPVIKTRSGETKNVVNTLINYYNFYYKYLDEEKKKKNSHNTLRST